MEELAIKLMIPLASVVASLGMTYGVFKTKTKTLENQSKDHLDRIKILEEQRVTIGERLATIEAGVKMLLRKEGLS